MEIRLRELELTYTQFTLLASTGWLGREGSPPTQQQVADTAGADRMMASKVIAILDGRGLVARRSDPLDARAKRLEVTPAGQELVGRAVRLVAEVDELFFGSEGDARAATREHLRSLAATPRP